MSASQSDLAAFVQSLGISASDAQLLMQLADEATARFASDPEATIWFESQVRRRRPDLWLLLQTNSAPRTAPH